MKNDILRKKKLFSPHVLYLFQVRPLIYPKYLQSQAIYVHHKLTYFNYSKPSQLQSLCNGPGFDPCKVARVTDLDINNTQPIPDGRLFIIYSKVLLQLNSTTSVDHGHFEAAPKQNQKTSSEFGGETPFECMGE